MGEKKADKDEKNKKNGDGGKKEETPTTVLLKVDMHCDGCASKILKCAKALQALQIVVLPCEGVETVKAESEANKLTVVGKLDPTKLRDKLANKTKKKVDLISPQPKKDNNNTNNNKDSKADNKKSDANSEKKTDEKKSKEPPVTTAVLKVSLHCQGCIERISKTVSKTKGVQDMSIDKDKELITVKGTMDAKALAESLQERLKRRVDVVPAKKEKDKEKEGGGEKDGGGAKEGGSNSGGKKKKGGGGGGGGGGVAGNGGNAGGGGGDSGKAEEDGGEGGGKMEQSRMEFMAPGYEHGYGYGHYYGPVYMGQVHAPQMFSDENPNACSIM